jgi:heme ABC exporter ATP-binding subunit CcmA
MAFSGVHVKRLTRRFDRQVILRTLSLDFPAGSCTALLGANGSGKTTLLRILATRLRPTRGEVRYGDVAWDDVDESVRGAIGVVGHGTMLYRDLTGRENLRFQARLHGLGDAHDRVERALAEVGMAEQSDTPVGRCSRGMAQRLALARALLHDPSLLLMDEPFTGLDREGSRGLMKRLAKARGDGCTIILVTHAPGDVAHLCDRVAVLKQGSVAHAGPFEGDAAALEGLLLEYLSADVAA